MPQLFVKVELRGTPDAADYSLLHNFMRQRHWYRTITGGRTTNLPLAVYQSHTAHQAPDLTAIANTLKADIQSNVWSMALVLVMQAENWALTT